MSDTIAGLQNDCLSLRVQLDQANATIDAQERIERDLRAGLERARSKLAELERAMDELRKTVAVDWLSKFIANDRYRIDVFYKDLVDKSTELAQNYARCANARNVIAAEMQGLRERADSRIDAVERSCWDLRERLIAAETRERLLREICVDCAEAWKRSEDRLQQQWGKADSGELYASGWGTISLSMQALTAALAASASIQTCDKCGGSGKV